MKSIRSLTFWLVRGFFGILVALALYDIWPALTPEAGDTISEVLWEIGFRHPFFVWVFGLIIGVLAGHFWWPNGGWVQTELQKRLSEFEKE